MHSPFRIFLAAPLLALIAAEPQPQGTDPAAGAPGVQVAQAAQRDRTFRNTEYGFRFVYPANWTQVTPDEPGVKVAVQAPPGPNPATCAMAVYDAPDLRSLTQAQLDWGMQNHIFEDQHWAALLRDEFTTLELKDPAVLRLGSRMARVVTAAGSNPTPNHSRILMIFTQSPGQVWHFACRTSAPDARTADAAFASRRLDFMRIISTLVWEN